MGYVRCRRTLRKGGVTGPVGKFRGAKKRKQSQRTSPGNTQRMGGLRNLWQMHGGGTTFFKGCRGEGNSRNSRLLPHWAFLIGGNKTLVKTWKSKHKYLT